MLKFGLANKNARVNSSLEHLKSEVGGGVWFLGERSISVFVDQLNLKRDCTYRGLRAYVNLREQ